jgi:hypothetical protein
MAAPATQGGMLRQNQEIGDALGVQEYKKLERHKAT